MGGRKRHLSSKPEDRLAWINASQKGAYRKPASIVRTMVSLPSSMPDSMPKPAPLEDWQVEFWQKLFSCMTPDEQRDFLWTAGDPESKKSFLMRYGMRGMA